MNWSTRSEVVAKLRKRWDSGEFLTAFATGHPWEPVQVVLRVPKPRDIGVNFAAVQEWAREWRDRGTHPLRVEYEAVGGRLIGVNRLPKRVWVDDYSGMWSLLGVVSEVDRFIDLVSRTRAAAPRLVEWMVQRPHVVLGLTDPTWAKIVDTVLWIDALVEPSIHVRQVDVPGVDTKFIDANRTIIAALLDVQLDESRVDRAQPASAFAARYGFLRKPRYVRYRWLDPLRTTAGFSELAVRVDEFTQIDVSRVFVLENEVTYLAFPEVADAVAIFGGGYSVTRLNALSWLRNQPLIYWGDIDTHGFTILDTLRREFPHTCSMLMDRATLLDHETQWVREEKPTTTNLPLLTHAEAVLHQDLVEDAFGPAVRLEQERIRFSAITRALESMSARAE